MTPLHVAMAALLSALCLAEVPASAHTTATPVVLIFESSKYVEDVVRNFQGLAIEGLMEIRQCSTSNCSLPDPLERVFAVVGRVPSELFQKLRGLQLVQSPSYMYPNLDTVPSHVTVASYQPDWRNTWGVEPIAEFCIAAVFQWQYRLQERDRIFSECAWATDAPKHCPSASDLTRHDTLMDKTLGVLGMGNIGHAVAKRAVALNMRTVATKHKAPFTSDLPLAWIGDDNDKLLRESDFVVVTVPGSILNVINATSLSLMKPGAVVIPVAAGPVDFEALRQAIAANRVGAVLDVWDDGCWHYPDYRCGEPYGQPSFPHRKYMKRKDGEGALVLPGMAMRDGRFWNGSAQWVAENLAALMVGNQLKGVVRNGTESILL